MKGRTHAAFALLLGLVAVLSFQVPFYTSILLLIVVTFTSLLPDIDEPESTVGKRVKIISWPFLILLGHRGIFHSLLIPAFLALLFLYLHQPYLMAAALIGYLSHLALDSLTHAGVRWFYPLPFKLKGAVKSGGIMDIILFLLSLVGIAVVILVNL